MINFKTNQLEKLEAAKAAWLVCISLLSLTGSFLVPLGPLGSTFTDFTGPYLVLLGYPAFLSLTGPYLALRRLTGPYWALLSLTGPYWALLGHTGPYWALTGPYWAFFNLLTDWLTNWLTNVHYDLLWLLLQPKTNDLKWWHDDMTYGIFYFYSFLFRR